MRILVVHASREVPGPASDEPIRELAAPAGPAPEQRVAGQQQKAGLVAGWGSRTPIQSALGSASLPTL